MPAGRPTDCTPGLIEKAWEYIGNDKEKNYQFHQHVVPSIVGLCRVINISRSAIYRWAEEEGNEFKDILEEIMDSQHFELANKGLAGDTNAAITKLMLTKHGYSDKQETEHSVPEGVSFNMNFSGSVASE